MPGPRTVIIVDDIAYVRKTLKQILSSHGFKVVGEAANGREAVALYTEARPDFVLMDLAMPVMNGVEATRQIIKTDSEACIVILSGLEQENLVTEAIHAGARDYVVKPFLTEEILKVIQQAYQQSSPISARAVGGIF